MFRIIPDGENFREYVLLKDGQSVLMRAATPADIPKVESFMDGLSLQTLQMRFMAGVAKVSRRFIEDLCVNDPRDRFCLIAIVGAEPDDRVVGLGNYIGLGGRKRAEVAFMVADDHQDRGIGTLVLERLAGIAAGNGYVGFEAEVLSDNQKMINVFRSSGFEAKQAFEGGSIHVEFPVGGAAALREWAEVRDRISSANSLIPLLRPKTVAVIGASRDPDSVGNMIFRNIVKANFQGTVYPVTRHAASVNGVKAYKTIDELPEPPELVVVAVRASRVLEVAEAAVRAGAKALIVVTSGFAETGPEGAELQRRLLHIVRSHGARLVGPNCLGLTNTSPDVVLNASLAPVMPPRGRVGFYSHSSALGLVIMDYAVARGLGFSTFVSAGNRADVSGNDLLYFWEEDPETDIALLYLETFGNPRRFARGARRVAQKKPVLCVKSARSRAGRSAARAHIGASAQRDVEVDVLFRQAGVIRANTLDEMFDVAVLLSTQPLPAGNRTGIISNSGGVVTICADACEASGLELAAEAVVDLGPLAPSEDYEEAIRAALVREDVDALIAIFAFVGKSDPATVGRSIRRGVARAEEETKQSKPVLLCLMGAPGAIQLATTGEDEPASRRVFPSYLFPESAALALGRVAQYAAFRRQPAGKLMWYEDAMAGAARHKVEPLVEDLEDPAAVVWLEGAQAQPILEDFRINVVPAPESDEPIEEPPLHLSIHSDPHFGPVIQLACEGRPPVERITPLMDTDAAEMVQAVGLCAGRGTEELLGRVSMMVEEVPWLSELHADLEPPSGQATGTPASLMGEVRLGLRKA